MRILHWKEGNVLFNDALNTFYLRLYGVRHMAKDHSDSEKGNPLPPHRLLFSINSKGSFFMHHSIYRIAHTTAFVTPVVDHWLELEIAQWVHPMKDRSDDPSHHERTLLPRSYNITLGTEKMFYDRTDVDIFTSADHYTVGYFRHFSIYLSRIKRPWYVLFCLWDGAYKRTIAANRKE